MIHQIVFLFRMSMGNGYEKLCLQHKFDADRAYFLCYRLTKYDILLMLSTLFLKNFFCRKNKEYVNKKETVM